MPILPINTIRFNSDINLRKNNIDDHPEVMPAGKYITNPKNFANPLIDINYGQLLVNKNKATSFKGGVSTLVPKIVGKIPLEDKVSWIVSELLYGDILLVGKNLKFAQELLQKYRNTLKGIIRNIYFVPDASLKETALLFQRNEDGAPHITNLGKDIIKLSIPSNVPVQPKTIPLRQGIGWYALQDSAVFNQNFLLKLNYRPTQDLSPYKEMFSTKYTFNDETKGAIEALNKKTIEALIPQEIKHGRKITFKDVGGLDSVIKRLKRDILFPIKYPAAHDGIQSHGVLLYGPPGTGKSLVAEALANETGAHFIKLNGLELSSKWVGETEKNWRNLFEEARSKQPCIIFLDEFEAVARKRGGQNVYADDTVNQMLTLLSDVEKNNDKIFLITATNNKNLVDPTVLRAGRIGNHILVGPPENIDGTKQIVDIHLKSKPIDLEFDKELFAVKLFKEKATGADIADIIYKAKLYCYDRTGITQKMENGSFRNSDLSGIKIGKEDFDKAFSEFLSGKNNSKRRPVGFNK